MRRVGPGFMRVSAKVAGVSAVLAALVVGSASGEVSIALEVAAMAGIGMWLMCLALLLIGAGPAALGVAAYRAYVLRDIVRARREITRDELVGSLTNPSEQSAEGGLTPVDEAPER